MNIEAEKVIGRPFGTAPLEEVVPSDITALTKAGDRLVATQQKRMITAQSKATLARAAMVDDYQTRLRQLANEASEALRRLDNAEAKRQENDERLLAAYEHIRSA